MLAEGGANVIMRLSGRKLKKSILHVGPQPKIGKKMHFFDFSKNASDHLYITQYAKQGGSGKDLVVLDPVFSKNKGL